MVTDTPPCRSQANGPFTVIGAVGILWIDSFHGNGTTQQRLKGFAGYAPHELIFRGAGLPGAYPAHGALPLLWYSHQTASKCTSQQNQSSMFPHKRNVASQRILVCLVVVSAGSEHFAGHGNLCVVLWHAELLYQKVEFISWHGQ